MTPRKPPRPPEPLDELALSIVVDERVHMRLTGPELVEAVRRLSAKGVTVPEMAPLLGITKSWINQIQRRNGIPPAPAPADTWFYTYLDRRRKPRTT